MVNQLDSFHDQDKMQYWKIWTSFDRVLFYKPVLKTLIDVFRLEFDHKNDTNNPVHLKIMILVLRVADRIFLYILFSYVLVIRQIKIKIQS